MRLDAPGKPVLQLFIDGCHWRLVRNCHKITCADYTSLSAVFRDSPQSDHADDRKQYDHPSQDKPGISISLLSVRVPLAREPKRISGQLFHTVFCSVNSKPVCPFHDIFRWRTCGETTSVKPDRGACRIPQRRIAAAKLAACGSAERRQCLAGKIIALDKGTHNPGSFPPPDRKINCRPVPLSLEFTGIDLMQKCVLCPVSQRFFRIFQQVVRLILLLFYQKIQQQGRF